MVTTPTEVQHASAQFRFIRSITSRLIQISVSSCFCSIHARSSTPPFHSLCTLPFHAAAFHIRPSCPKTSETKLEEMFKKYDADQSGYIEYAEFKKIWVRMSNVKKELTDRGVKIPKITTTRMLYTLLEQILDAEEDR